MPKKLGRIFFSSLSARYYVDDGWTLPILSKYLTRCKWVLSQNEWGDYYLLDTGARIDVDLLLKDYTILKDGPFKNDYEDIKLLLESRNW